MAQGSCGGSGGGAIPCIWTEPSPLKITAGGLTSGEGGLKYRKFPAKSPGRLTGTPASGFMTPSSPSELPDKRRNMPPCKHPRVQIVAREEDSEFVECKECGDIFESSEFKDMIIEDTKLPKES